MRTALITGASGGIGSKFAFQLASEGWNLILTSRNIEELKKLKKQILKKHNVAITLIKADLLVDKDLNFLISKAKKEKSLSMIVNDAGFGIGDEFRLTKINYMADMIRLHVHVPTTIIRELMDVLLKNKSYIINISSLAAFFPLKKSSIYSATKAYLLSFSESLHLELKGRIKVQALCPGFVNTDFFRNRKGKNKEILKDKRIVWMQADDVVKKSLKDLKKRNKVICIPGRMNKFLYFLSRIFPRRVYYCLVR